MAQIGINTGFKDLLLIMIFPVLFFSCNNKEQKQDHNYLLTDSKISLYTNQYSNGVLIKSDIISTTKNDYGQETYREEVVYSYDAQKYLIKKESYDISEGQRNLSSIDLYSPEKDEYITFRSYPKDTASYNYKKKNSIGLVTEKFQKDNFLDYQKEVLIENQYDNADNLTISTEKDLLNGISIIYKYDNETIQDTLITNTYENGTLLICRKKYRDKDVQIEASVRFINNARDTIYTTKNRICTVAYENNSKIVDIIELDSLGNWAKYEYRLWKLRQY